MYIVFLIGFKYPTMTKGLGCKAVKGLGEFRSELFF